MARVKVEDHPHMFACPHCGAYRPIIEVSRDALELSIGRLDNDGLMTWSVEREVSMLDNYDAHFRCCSAEVHDDDLASALIERVYDE